MDGQVAEPGLVLLRRDPRADLVEESVVRLSRKVEPLTRKRHHGTTTYRGLARRPRSQRAKNHQRTEFPVRFHLPGWRGIKVGAHGSEPAPSRQRFRWKNPGRGDAKWSAAGSPRKERCET